MKRSFRGEQYERADFVEETAKKQNNEFVLAHIEKQGKNRKKTMVSTSDCYTESDCFSDPYNTRSNGRVLKEQLKPSEIRREMNRQRAKENREQKKIMMRIMEEKISLLTIDNEQLRLTSQIQATEIDQLRNICQSSASNNRVSFRFLFYLY